MEVPLQELAFTIEPLLTAVHIFRKEGGKNQIQSYSKVSFITVFEQGPFPTPLLILDNETPPLSILAGVS